ncbi:MAG: hypothetical protein IJ690_01035 [Clostridia bacterium]|nr:hypothetical protein [Clostridia bacterium]
MEEIKVGDFIRSNDGYIAKIIEIKKAKRDCDTYYCTDVIMASGFYEHIKKHSPNIIDLIEEGDYVNGKLIHKVDIRENSAYIYYGNGKTFCDYQIKDIVTKEQFEQMKYIVGE